MRPRPRLRVAILVALAMWLALLAIALAGGWVGAPVIVGQVAIAIWAGAGMFLIPAFWLLTLFLEEGIGPGSTRAVKMAPYLVAVGSLVLIVGVLLLAPSRSATIPLRIAGGWAFAWGGFALFVGVIALRKKRRTRVGTRP